jgi:hypothetical protein
LERVKTSKDLGSEAMNAMQKANEVQEFAWEFASAEAEGELISRLALNSTMRAFYERRSERIRELAAELQAKSLPARGNSPSRESFHVSR